MSTGNGGFEGFNAELDRTGVVSASFKSLLRGWVTKACKESYDKGRADAAAAPSPTGATYRILETTGREIATTPYADMAEHFALAVANRWSPHNPAREDGQSYISIVDGDGKVHANIVLRVSSDRAWVIERA